MSYCRFGGDSDVYVFRSNLGLECCFCNLQEREWVKDSKAPFGGYFKNIDPMVPHVFDTEQEMINHLIIHRQLGDRVPDGAFDRLRAEMKQHDKRRTRGKNQEALAAKER